MLVTTLVTTMPIWLPLVIGLIGTGLEATGKPVLVAIGKRLEAISIDFPKLLGKK
jgi:hypothetical protein